MYNEKLTITLPQFNGQNILQTSFVHGCETEPVAGLKLRHDRLSKDYQGTVPIKKINTTIKIFRKAIPTESEFS